MFARLWMNKHDGHIHQHLFCFNFFLSRSVDTSVVTSNCLMPVYSPVYETMRQGGGGGLIMFTAPANYCRHSVKHGQVTGAGRYKERQSKRKQ